MMVSREDCFGDYSRWKAFVACAMAFLTFFSASSALAQQQPERFDDWELSCPAPTENSKPSCRLTQQLAIKDSGQTVFVLTILPGEKKSDLVGIVSIPLGGYIAPGIELRIDGRKAYKLLVETCNSGGCHAGFPVSASLQKELVSGKNAVFRLWTTKAKPTDVTLSLAGTAKALMALRERSGK